MSKISIIGTSGRDKSKIHTKELFEKMVATTKDILTNFKDIILVSGGAAWSDHVAVRLFLEGFADELVLHLPCDFINGQFIDNGEKDWRINPGSICNFYHRQFSKIICSDSLSEIEMAVAKGATVTTSKSFSSMNTLIAQSDYMIAFSWSNSQNITGGTADTWKKATGQKYHVNLNQL